VSLQPNRKQRKRERKLEDVRTLYLYYTGSSESRCALIKAAGSDVQYYSQTLSADLLVRCFLCMQLLQFLIH